MSREPSPTCGGSVQAEAAGDRLDQDELLGIAHLLLVAGYETTAHPIESAALRSSMRTSARGS